MAGIEPGICGLADKGSTTEPPFMSFACSQAWAYPGFSKERRGGGIGGGGGGLGVEGYYSDICQVLLRRSFTSVHTFDPLF